eukprot:CAMPEP_0172521566 /NCGR_PEP_ID=MMETSP1066-20121228/292643_1 /TAXON_ID=671091 /ORGANISM="Coscinodiscus wailesii, Strain CCMP2513" /LENGTH=328 /DNA_ID=CAMNT_0013304491 /DNA_START=60 /DNA_END=1046 /DNA_ORIENTATION=+
MKFSSAILGLCVVGISAFTHPVPARTFKAQSELYSLSERAAYDASPSMAGSPSDASRSGRRDVDDVWDTLSPITVQGNALRTWSLSDPYVERVQVYMRTDGRPLNANVELWQGPDNTPQKMSVYLEDGDMRPFNGVIETPSDGSNTTPQKMSVYLEDGDMRPFSGVIETPSDGSNTIAIRNTGYLEFPLSACVEAEVEDAIARSLSDMGSSERKIVQGGAIYTTPFAPNVQNVHVFLKTDGRPLNARVELLQGPNNNKQVIEFYSEDGMIRPMNIVFETPGVGNVVRIVNTATVEFPLIASVKPLIIDGSISNGTGRWGSDREPFILS